MTHLRTILNDMVERKLWPVALLLIVALAAVPVVLGRNGEVADDPATVPSNVTGTPGTDTATQAYVELDTGAPVDRERAGKVRNPFKGPAAKAASTETPSEQVVVPVPSAPSASEATTSGSSGGSTGTTGTTGTTDSTAPTTTPDSSDDSSTKKATYKVSLRFGQTGNEKTIRDIARLSPLPSVTDPFFVFLGVLKDGKTAVFMVSSDAAPTGDGSCKPSAADCQTIHLKADEEEWFDFTNPDGSVVQYRMKLLSVREVEVSSESKARAAYARHSRVGAEILRDAAVHASAASKGAKRYRYLPKRGVLVRAKTRKRAAATATAGALVPGASEAVGLAPRKKQPGVAVWHWDAGKAER
jgi:hypothetical protein